MDKGKRVARVVDKFCAQLSLAQMLHRPELEADKLLCPMLISLCDRDSLTVPSTTEATSKWASKRGTVKPSPIGHYYFYLGGGFMDNQVEFLQKTLAAGQR
ncbi:MAG: hypothetical protein ACU0CA_00015 [Paracoccaceae bacterium]